MVPAAQSAARILRQALRIRPTDNPEAFEGQLMYVARNDWSFCAANATVTLLALSSGGNTRLASIGLFSSSSASQLAQTA